MALSDIPRYKYLTGKLMMDTIENGDPPKTCQLIVLSEGEFNLIEWNETLNRFVMYESGRDYNSTIEKWMILG